MGEVTVVYWRDIPAQVIAGRGRKAVKIPLSARFEEAVDRAAMQAGVSGTDAYLAEWRKDAAPDLPETSDPEAAARAVAERIEAEYDRARLRRLVENDGRA